MWIYEIKDDSWIKVGETPRLGWHADHSTDNEIQIDPNGYFPFTRACFSMGDWGIISALPQLLQSKYPNLTISIPSKEWLEARAGSGTWGYQGMNAVDNVDLIFANNPYIDHRFNLGDYTTIITDHHRCYKYETEPLVEQLLRAWGFTEEEIWQLDTRPQLYFSDEEKQIGDEIIGKYIGSQYYGCTLFAARIEKYNTRWTYDIERGLENWMFNVNQFPVFSYSTMPIDDWKAKFPEWIDFKDIPLASIRVQMYIKQQGLFNIGYQSGLGDACTGKSIHYIATPYEKLTETIIRGDDIWYHHGNGARVCYAR